MKTGKISIMIIWMAAMVLLSSCLTKKAVIESELTVTPLGDNNSVSEGAVVYALPMTLFTVLVGFERTIEKPGPYARFADEMLGLKDIITAEKESWLIRSITVETGEEADPSEFYIIESDKLVQTNALALKKAGLILDLNPMVNPAEQRDIQTQGRVNRKLSFNDMGSDEYYISRHDTAFRVVKLDTTFIRIPYLIERKRQLTIEQMAERAAKTLLELREGRHLILTGEANVYPQGSAPIEEINRMEKEYTALFTGKTATERRILKYTYIPDRSTAGKPQTLFTFSTNEGPSVTGSKSGIPVTVEVVPAAKTRDITIISRAVTENKMNITQDKLFYRPPEAALLRIKH